MLLTSGEIRPKLMAYAPKLVVFDKGGTLIDFHGMWSTWVIELAQRLERAAGLALSERLFHVMGFDAATRGIDPEGKLATEPMSSLRELCVDALCEAGLTHQASEDAVAAAWYAPDPVADARPLVDIAALFTALREHGLRIAIATMDDRAPTETTLANLGAADLVDALICADDGLPLKPAPDMVRRACQATGVDPAQAVVVGDSAMDLEMGRAAGVGMVVGVLTGVASEAALAPQADVVLGSVADLV